jgi:hypothetical protein
MSDDDLLRLVRLAMIRDGHPLIPVTPAEVAEAEKWFDAAAIVLPPSLRDPDAILRGGNGLGTLRD